jgi:selenocysteine lyase/cysteine desulfurase
MRRVIAPPAPLPPPRLGSRALFPALAARSYLNHAGVSPPSLAVTRAVAAQVEGHARAGAHALGDTFALRARLREKAARLVGGAADDVALTSGTTHGLQAIALSFPWCAGDRVVLLEGEFPANVTPWLRTCELFGVRPVFLRAADFGGDSARGLEALDAALAGGARLLTTSSVQFQTGLAMPLREMAAICRRHGAALCVDAVQSAGVVPIDFAALGADYVACGAHKWLLGVEGAGFLWIRPGRVEELRPALAGWLSHEEAVSVLTAGEEGLLRYDRPLRRRAQVFEGSSSSALSQAALDASLALLLELGVESIFAHVQAFHDRLEPALRARGLEVLREATPARRSGTLAARPPPGVSALAIRDGLAARGIVIAIPDGKLRFAPHWPNALDETDLVIASLDEVLQRTAP